MAIPTPEQLRARFGQIKGGADTQNNNSWDCQVSDLSTKTEVFGAGFLDAVVEKLRVGDEVKMRTSDEGTVTVNITSNTVPVAVIDKTGGVNFVPPVLNNQQIVFGDGTNVPAQDVNFVYDSATETMAIGRATVVPDASLFLQNPVHLFGVNSGGTAQRDSAAIFPGAVYSNLETGRLNYTDNIPVWHEVAKLTDIPAIGARSYGGLYISSETQTSIITINVYEKVDGTTTSSLLQDFTMPANNRLTYTGGTTKVFNVDVTMSLEGTSGGDIYEIALFKNAVVQPGSEMREQIKDLDDPDTTGFNALISLETNDFVEVFIRNLNSATDATAMNMTVVATEV